MTLLHQAAQKAVEAPAVHDAIRDAGGIVHSDGNIFFTNAAKFMQAVAALQQQPEPVACDHCGEQRPWVGLCDRMGDLCGKAAAREHASSQEEPRGPVAWLYTRVEDGRRILAFAPNPGSVGQWEPLYASPSTTRQQEVGSDGKLWCVNVWGPDDVYAMPNRAAALERADSMNIEFGSIPRHEHDPIMLAVVIEWPHTPESHAEDLSRYAASPSTPERAEKDTSAPSGGEHA